MWQFILRHVKQANNHKYAHTQNSFEMVCVISSFLFDCEILAVCTHYVHTISPRKSDIKWDELYAWIYFSKLFPSVTSVTTHGLASDSTIVTSLFLVTCRLVFWSYHCQINSLTAYAHMLKLFLISHQSWSSYAICWSVFSLSLSRGLSPAGHVSADRCLREWYSSMALLAPRINPTASLKHSDQQTRQTVH